MKFDVYSSCNKVLGYIIFLFSLREMLSGFSTVYNSKMNKLISYDLSRMIISPIKPVWPVDTVEYMYMTKDALEVTWRGSWAYNRIRRFVSFSNIFGYNLSWYVGNTGIWLSLGGNYRTFDLIFKQIDFVAKCSLWGYGSCILLVEIVCLHHLFFCNKGNQGSAPSNLRVNAIPRSPISYWLLSLLPIQSERFHWWSWWSARFFSLFSKGLCSWSCQGPLPLGKYGNLCLPRGGSQVPWASFWVLHT